MPAPKMPEKMQEAIVKEKAEGLLGLATCSATHNELFHALRRLALVWAQWPNVSAAEMCAAQKQAHRALGIEPRKLTRQDFEKALKQLDDFEKQSQKANLMVGG